MIRVPLTGASGQQYPYEVYPINQAFNPLGANYVFLRKEANGFKIIYLGKTKNLSERFDHHHAMPCIKKNGATHTGIHLNSLEQDRTREEEYLPANYNTSCDTINN